MPLHQCLGGPPADWSEIVSAARLRLFVVAGMPRSGTTFLYHNLQKHPALFLPFRKESNYFAVNYARGVEWYRSLYRKITPDQVGGDISPFYFMDQRAIPRIAEFSPDVKVILAVREPAEWAVSLHNQILSYDRRVPRFEEFIKTYPFKAGRTRVSIQIAGGFVGRMIEAYRQTFGDRLLLYDFALFRRDPLTVLCAIERFLGIPRFFESGNFDNVVINAANRRNIRWLASLMTNDTLLWLLGRMLPRMFIQKTRGWLDLASRNKANKTEASGDQENLEIAKRAFAEDSRTVSSLFEFAELQLGSGMPFDRDNVTPKSEANDPASQPNGLQNLVTSQS